MFFRTLFSRFAVCAAAAVCAASVTASAQNSAPKLSEFTNHATVWPDNNGAHISAHGGCMLKVGDTYYWYGEHRTRDRKTGVHAYSSKDLYNWKDEGVGKIARIVLKLFATESEWEEYWRKRMDLNQSVMLNFKVLEVQ